MTGLEIIRAPGTTAEQIADIIAEHCPPITPEHCDKLSCRECWLAWIEESKELKDQFSSNRGAEAKPYHRPCMMELRSIMREWQQKNSAPLSALKICVEAFLAEERKQLLTSHPYQEQEECSAEPD